MKRTYFKQLIGLIVSAGTAFCCNDAQSQAPNISYASSQTYTVGTPINPLSPSNTGGPVTTQVSTFATGFYHPAGMAIDANNNIYLADELNNVIKKITPSGVVSVFAGNGTKASINGYGTSASFNYPAGLAIDPTGTRLYVSDFGGNVIRAITLSNQYVGTIDGTGAAGETDGISLFEATFNGPLGLAVDGSGNIYVADYTGQKIRKIDGYTLNVSTLAGSGYQGTADGTGSGAYFNYPSGLRVDGNGNVYVTDRSSDLIRKITPGGTVTTIAGMAYSEYSASGTGTSASFYRPSDLAFDASGNIYITDYLGNQIRKLNTSTTAVSTIAGSGYAGSTDGSGSAASFNGPFGIVVDGSGNLFVSDIVNNTVRKITTGAFSISPALPAGLVFDQLTGTISGTPTVGSALTTYTITATNSSGPNSTTLNIAVFGNSAINPSYNKNYIITYTPRTPIPDITQFAGKNVGDVNQNIQYFDGLGRPMQTVQWQGSPNHSDIIQPITYDQYGREATKYLPYANSPVAGSDGSYKADAITVQQSAFYSSGSWEPNVVHTPFPSANTAFEPSLLNRVVEQGAPGQAWQLSTSGISNSGHTLRVTYGVNDNTTATATVSNWQVNTGGNGATINGNYPANTLYSTIITDENGNNSIEFKDMQGKVVCKKIPDPTNSGVYLSTCYIYDDYDNLAYVVPPTKDNTTYPGSFTEVDPVFLNYIYAYHYDSRKRLIEKKIPGKGWEFLIYNKIDQAIMTQDANQRNKTPQEWSFIKYDGQGRVVITGAYPYPGSTADGNIAIPNKSEEIWLQNYANGQSIFWEVRDNNQVSGYTNQACPQGSANYLTINYYDDYTFPGNPYGPWNNYATNPTGLLTANKITVLNPDGSYGPMLLSVNYYDDKGRIGQIFKQHYLNSVSSNLNYDAIQYTYNFDNSIAAMYRYHFTTNNSTVAAVRVDNAYFYDHAGRRFQNWEAITMGGNPPQPSILLSQLDYNEVGQLKTKHLHNTGGATFLQNINYAYNERGWLTNSTAQLFAIQLNYNSGVNIGPFNGNISSQYWGTTGNLTKSYMYTYDALNRLTTGVSPTEGFAEQNIQYDNMGNITSLNRVNPLASLNTTYTYNYYNSNQSNLLQSVSGLTNGSYTYDNNGNLSFDARTGNTNYYNRLDLPRNIHKNGLNIDYTYTALGQKLRKDNGTIATDYINGIQYDNGNISFIQTEEGRVLNLTGTYNFEYTLTDHLGNARVTFDSNGGGNTVKQTNDYLPFGMLARGTTSSPANQYLYNSKELQAETDQYDYAARFYDPVIARWVTSDPLAEGSRRHSPYSYGYNNPIRFVDPDGMHPLDGGVGLIVHSDASVETYDLNTLKTISLTSAGQSSEFSDTDEPTNESQNNQGSDGGKGTKEANGSKSTDKSNEQKEDDDKAKEAGEKGAAITLAMGTSADAANAFLKANPTSVIYYANINGALRWVATSKVLEVAEKLGKACVVGGILIDGVLYATGHQDGKKTLRNISVTLVAFAAGGPLGIGIGLGYYALDQLGVFDPHSASYHATPGVNPIDNLKYVRPITNK